MDFPIKNGDFPWQNVSSPEGIQFLVVHPSWYWIILKWRPGIQTIHEWDTLWWTNILPWKDPPFLMGKSTISMAIFNCYVSSPEGNLRYSEMPLFTEAAGRNRWSICYLGKRRCDSSQAAGKQEMIVHSLVTTTGHFMGLVKFGTGIYLIVKACVSNFGPPQKNHNVENKNHMFPIDISNTLGVSHGIPHWQPPILGVDPMESVHFQSRWGNYLLDLSGNLT